MALGAVASAFIVAVTVHENTSKKQSRVRAAASLAFYGGAAAASIYLLDGMYEIQSILAVDVLTTGSEQAGNLSTEVSATQVGRGMVIRTAIVGAGAGLAGWLTTTKGRENNSHPLSTPKWVGKALGGALILLWVGAVAWTTILDSSGSGFSPRTRFEQAYTAGWFAIFALGIGLMVGIERLSYRNVTAEEEAPEKHQQPLSEVIGLLASIDANVSQPHRPTSTRRRSKVLPAFRQLLGRN